MSTRCFLTRSLPLLGLILISRSASAGNDLSCIAELSIPPYPLIARQARLNGTAEVWVKIDNLGNVERTRVVSSSKQFDEVAIRALSKARYQRECATDEIRVTFLFEIDKNAEEGQPGIRQLLFRAPNIFVIRAAPPKVNVRLSH